jgi:ribonuclease D
LIAKVLDLAPNKVETRTDWRRRPLSGRQIQYALDDARHLRPLRDKLFARLDTLGRLDWLREEMETWRADVERAFGQEQWQRVSGNAGLSSRGLAVLRELWRWREAEARRRDCPARRVLRDDLMVELAKRQTADVRRIQAVRGLERSGLQRRLPEIAERIRQALELPDDQCPARFRRDRASQHAVLGQFLASALGSVCRRAQLAPALVGTPNDVRDLIAYRTGEWNGSPPKLAHGWRAELVGRLFENLLAGKTTVRVVDPDSEHPLAFESWDESGIQSGGSKPERSHGPAR